MEFRNVRLGSSASSTPIEGKKYSYDSMGNITMISQSTGSYYPLIAYEYDSQNQLIKETYYDGKGTGSAHVTDTYEYTYDTAGNILSEKKNGTVTKKYTYGDSQWNDLLTEYNEKKFVYEGQTYNAKTDTVSGIAKSGNPTDYYNENYYYYMEWENGRQLSYMSVETEDDRFRTAYNYDADGVRCSKYIENDEHLYVTQNGKVVRETIKSGNSVKVLDFIYDESGRPFALKYSTNGGRSFTTYYYVLNLQGDVVKLINKNGATYASYTYDAWGKVLTATGSMANINPLRYRGYYYDEETHFYYLQSRYYDPATHRFINADAPEYSAMSAYGLNNSNLFAYCGNNPVRRIDYSGMWWGEDVWEWVSETGEKFCGWCKDTFGFAAYVSNSYDAIALDTVFWGAETGTSTSQLIAGDNSKPVVFYAQAASSWWKVWEYKFGISFNVGDGGGSIGAGIGNMSVSVSADGTSIEGAMGADKTSITISKGVDYKQHTAESYAQAYVRPWSCGLLTVLGYVTGGTAVTAAIALTQ